VLIWNIKRNDRLGSAVEIGVYQVEKTKPASVTITNEYTDGFILADVVGFIKISS
jgi:hypothetical protein